MDQTKKNEQLEKRIEELEYRLSILENFLDSQGVLFGKEDSSMMDAMKIAVKGDLKSKGYDVNQFQNRLGKKFYLNE